MAGAGASLFSQPFQLVAVEPDFQMRKQFESASAGDAGAGCDRGDGGHTDGGYAGGVRGGNTASISACTLNLAPPTCSAEHMPAIKSGSCALAIAAQSFHWFANQETLAEVARVLAPGGTFVGLQISPTPSFSL
jgi:SAM-dependent methyltransferase